jgi:hypothetical protein
LLVVISIVALVGTFEPPRIDEVEYITIEDDA